MNTAVLGASEIPHMFGFIERRRKPRITTPFEARIRGCDARGRRFKSVTTVCNLSVGGIYLCLTQIAAPGTPVCIAMRLRASHTGDAHQPGHVLLRGIILRSETLADGVCGIAVKVNCHRFW
jgi:c-di-GMP-binding flagellar brake protein YcgR